MRFRGRNRDGSGYDYDLDSIGVPGKHQGGRGCAGGINVFMPVFPRSVVTRIDKNATSVIRESPCHRDLRFMMSWSLMIGVAWGRWDIL